MYRVTHYVSSTFVSFRDIEMGVFKGRNARVFFMYRVTHYVSSTFVSFRDIEMGVFKGRNARVFFCKICINQGEPSTEPSTVLLVLSS